MTAVQDTMPSLREKKTWVVLCVSIFGFLGGLAVTCEVRNNWQPAAEITDLSLV